MSEVPTIRVIEQEVDPLQLIRDHIKQTGTDESFFIADIGEVVRKFILWHNLFPDVEPRYAFKCNNHASLVSTLGALGAGYDCASRGEIEKVLSMGIQPDKIVFAQTVKPVSHINFAKDNNVSLMTFDNEEELLKVKKHFPAAQLLLRLAFNPKTSNKIGFGEKFGCLPGEKSQSLLRKAKELDLNVKGTAFHIGIGCLEYEIYEQAIKDSAETIQYGNSIGFEMDILDIGGGFPGTETKTVTSISKVVNKSIKKYIPNANIKFISEPGQYLVDKAFTLAASVHSKNIKIDNNGEKVYHYYITDGIYQSFNMASSHGFLVEMKTLDDPTGKPLNRSIIWGRACDSHDIVARDVYLPEMECGDWLVFENSGAYRISTSTTFNGFPNHPVYSFISKNLWETFKKMKLPDIQLGYNVIE